MFIAFTGGEVFVRKDFIEILEYAYKKRFVVEIFTNGILMTDTDLIKVAGVRPKTLHFSIYSNVADRHDYITQLKGSFFKTVGTIKKAVSLGIAVNIKFPILEFNKDDIGGVMALAKELGATIQISFPVFPKDNGDMAPTELRVKTAEGCAKAMRDIGKNINFIGEYISEPYEPNEHVDTKGRPICRAGDTELCINPYGEVYPCSALKISLGNIKDKALRDIWENSTALKEWREIRCNGKKGCEGCQIAEYCCFCAGSALKETGDPLMKYNEACTLAQARKLLSQKI
jgi:radical SAM protein with 4Fe4S-binding SPASM domain